MQIKTKLILFLLLIPPLVELITGSTPLLLFLNPILLILFILMYGVSNILIREIRNRWDLQWSVIFLAILYGIFEEGFLMQSFFNVGHEDLGALSNYGIFLGVQWPWTINLIIFHATISTLIPLYLTDTIWPEFKDKSLLKNKGFFLSFLGLTLVTIAVFRLMKYAPMYSLYTPNKLLLFITICVMIILIYLAYYFKDTRISYESKVLHPFLFFIFGFLFQAINILLPNIFAENGVSSKIVLFLQLIFVLIVIIFSYCQIYNKNITNKHLTSLTIGNIAFFSLVTFLIGILNLKTTEQTFGMPVVSIITLILLLFWRRKIVRVKTITT